MASTNGQLRTIRKGVQILGLFSEETPLLDTSMIAERVGLPKSTAYKYVHTFEGLGFLVREKSGRFFKLGPRVIELASIALDSPELVDISYPMLSNLVAQTNETALLTGIMGSAAVCLSRIESPQYLKVTYHVGATYPLYAGASALVLLAGLNEPARERILNSLRLISFTKNTVTSKTQLSARLDQIKQQGFAVSRGEYTEGVFAVTAPIYSTAKDVLGSVSLAGPVHRLNNEREDRYIALVKESALAIMELMENSPDRCHEE